MSSLSVDALVFQPLLPAPHPILQRVLSSLSYPTGSNTELQVTSVCRDTIANPNWSKMTMSGSIDVNKQKRQGRSSTPSSSGSAMSSWRTIQKGLQGAKGISPSSPGKYFAPTGISDGWPVAINFICLSGCSFYGRKIRSFSDLVFENIHSFYFSP